MKNILFILLFSFSFCLNAQSSIEKIAESYFEYYKYPKERFVCQFNKENYYPGEDVYFQIYVLDSRDDNLFLKTEKVCLLLFDSDGKRILKKYLQVKKGVSANFFTIPKEYSSSVMFYKILSNWSLNFQSQKAKPIFINVNNAKREKPTGNITSLKVFPESGNLVDDLTSVVYVSTFDKFSNGVVVEGVIKNTNNEEIAFFKTDSLGYGRFFLKPKFNQKYHVEILDSNSSKKFNLPRVLKNGLVFNVLEKGKDFYFGFRGNLKTKDNLSYLIHSNGKIGIAGNLILDENHKKAFYFPKEKFLQGINTLSVFKGNKLLGERSFFNSYNINNSQGVKVSSKRIHRDSVRFTLSKHLKDSLLNLSVSILPKENKSVKENDLFQKKYLSFIEDSINKLGYNSNKNISKVKKFFSTYTLKTPWIKILNKDTISIQHFFEKGFSFSGRLINKKNGDIIKNTDVNFFTNYEAGGFKTDSSGYFSIKELFFYKDEQIKIHPQTEKKVYTKLQLEVPKEKFDTIINVNLKKSFLGKEIIDRKFSPFFDDSYEVLNEIELKAKKDKVKKDPSINPLDNTSFVDKFEVDKDNVYNYRTVLQYIEAKASLLVDNKSSYVTIYNQRTNSQTIIANGGVKPMNVYVNQILLNPQDVEMLKGIYMHQVKSIRINKSGIGGGGQDPFGSIHIYLNKKGIFKKLKKTTKKKSKVLYVNLIDGFSKSKKYKTTDYIYEVGSKIYNQYATLHWEPEIKMTNKDYSFQAHIPKKIKEFILIIQGISNKGNIIDIKLNITQE